MPPTRISVARQDFDQDDEPWPVPMDRLIAALVAKKMSNSRQPKRPGIKPAPRSKSPRSPRLTEQQVELAVKMFGEGKEFAEIGAAVDRAENTTRALISRLRLDKNYAVPKRKPGPKPTI